MTPHNKGQSSLTAFLLILAISTTKSGNGQYETHSRQKRQILADQPRILTQAGHLVFQSGANHNITFRSGNGGAVFIDDLNIKRVASQVTTNKASIESIRASTGNASMERRLRNIEGQMTSFSSRLDSLSNSIDTLRNRVDNSLSTLGTRISNLESRVNSGGTSSNTMTQIVQLVGQFHSLEHRVNDLEHQEETQQEEIENGIRTVTNRVESLETLLERNECSSSPCINGGTCIDVYNGYRCRCPPNFQGQRCDEDVNECVVYANTDLSCQHGTCTNTHGGFTCQCDHDWHGIHCNERHDDCTGASHAELCGHGTCVNEDRVQAGQPKFRCICETGWEKAPSSPACTVDVDECSSGRHCSADPPVFCINLPGSFACGSCPAGFTGNGYTCSDINECQINNGGCSRDPFVQCTNTRGSSHCAPCPSGYTGDGRSCQPQDSQSLCSIRNGGCHPQATCTETTVNFIPSRVCVCPVHMIGNGVGSTGCEDILCLSIVCSNGGTCVSTATATFCNCAQGWTGPHCTIQWGECPDDYCRNGGTCTDRSENGFAVCSCPPTFTGRQCEQELTGCGGIREGNSGTIVFPSVGDSYGHNLDCVWSIRVDSSKRARLQFTAFDIEADTDCDFDKVEVSYPTDTGEQISGPFCGTDIPNNGEYFVSTTNRMDVRITTDSSVGRDGFTLTWDSLDSATDQVCGGHRETSTSGVITSPGYPENYPHDASCEWTVQVPTGFVIRFTFTHLAIEHHSECIYDWVEIRDGISSSDTSLVRYCSSSTPQPVQTTTASAFVAFYSDGSASDSGFSLTFEAVQATGDQGCGGYLSGSTGMFSSPNWPSPHQANQHCEWTIHTPPGTTVLLTFTAFSLEYGGSSCDYDYVQVQNTDGEIQNSYCGSTLPAPVTYPSNSILVVFHSDDSINADGFQARWSTGCDQSHTGPEGTVMFDMSSRPRECRHVITVQDGYRVRLLFSALDIGSTTDQGCENSYFQVFDGPTDASRQIGLRICNNNRLDDVRSTGNVMMVKLVLADVGPVSPTNMALFTQEDLGSPLCGGVLMDSAGFIESPGYPSPIFSGANCTWNINVAAGLVVSIHFRVMDLPGRTSEGCANYVELFDGDTPDPTTSLGKFCGRSVPAVLTSSDNAMTIRLQMGPVSNMRGFQANYVTNNMTAACGSQQPLTEETGVITSPNFPMPYPHGRDCAWVIQGQGRRQIGLTFSNFSLEGQVRCAFDYLEIRDGAYPSSPIRYKLCGASTNLPRQPIISTSRAFYLHFHSDSSVPDDGFSLQYDMASTGCGAVLTSPTGTITSPNYPQPYHHDDLCTWTITVSRGSRLTLIFEDFDIEEVQGCHYDRLVIRDQNEAGPYLTNGTTALCGDDNPGNMTSQSNKVWVQFETDWSNTGRGFILHYRTECSGTLTALRGVIESPNFPHAYPHYSNCSWVIEAPASNKINVSLAALHIEHGGTSCPFDKLQFRNGRDASSPLLHEFCGTEIPESFQSPSNVLFVHFQTDGSVAYDGFRLEYVFDGCGGIINANSGTLTSPGYPGNYDHQVQCLWQVNADLGKSIQITVHDLDVEQSSDCRFDSLEIYSGSDDTAPRVVQLCGRQDTQHTYAMNGNNMYVKFRTDRSINGNGFRATFESTDGGCGGNFTGRQGTITSPGFPQYPTAPMTCEWSITVDPHANVVINFTTAELYGWSCSSGASLTIYNGANASTPVGFQLCPTLLHLPTVFQSTSNQVFLRFISRSTASTNRKGFSLNYTTGCGGTIIVEEGQTSIVQSPGYPSNANLGTECLWTIQGPSGQYGVPLSLSFLGLHVGSYQSCESNYVEVSLGTAHNGSRYCGETLPPAAYGTDLIRVRYVATTTRGKFKAIASSFHAGCGGNIQSDSGRFVSPGFPDSYLPNTQCVWQINVSPGNQMMLSFSQFNLASYGDINSDYLEIRSPDVNGVLIGRWIDQDTPSNLTSLDGAWIKFRSDADGLNGGASFVADWNTVYGGSLTGSRGQVASPRYPNYYPRNANYRWTITGPSGNIIKMDFVEIQMEDRLGGEESCPWADYLEVYDGDEITGELLGTYCGQDSPDSLYSTTNMVTLVFGSDMSIQAKGFLLNWTAVPDSARPQTTPEATGCGGNLFITDDLQTLTSPGNLTGYENNLDCTWNLQVPEGSTAMINVTYLDLERHSVCAWDYLEVTNDLGITGQKLCGRGFPDGPIRLEGEHPAIRFRTDSSITRTGFQLTYTKGCGGQFRTTSSHTITSPGYPRSYASNTNCTWSVLVRAGKTVQVDFNSPFNIAYTGSCASDYVQLLNGQFYTSPPLYLNTSTTNTNGRYCGATPPESLETSSNALNVQFVSDEASEAQGFSLNFTEKAVACGGHIRLTGSTDTRVITSPNYPSPYPHHVDCVWVFIAPAETRIQVHFEGDFLIEPNSRCRYDYIQFRDGGSPYSPLLGNRLCGRELPSTQVSVGSVLYMRFAADSSVDATGFKATVSIATCGGRILASSEGVITSPDYPQNYHGNYDCEWQIAGPVGHFMDVWLSEFYVTPTPNCSSGDYLEFRETNATGYLLSRVCGRGPGYMSQVTSADNKIWVKFHSESSGDGGKFKLSFNASADECGGQLTTGSGIIRSPNYPMPYAHRRRCLWHIRVQEGRRITLNFDDVDIEDQSACRFDYIVVYNGVFDLSPLMGRYCGSGVIAPVQSSGNSMTVGFLSDASITGRGFQLSYSSNEEAECGGVFQESSGVVTNPGFNQTSYNHSVQCVWRLHNPSPVNSSFLIQFTHMNLEYGGGNCRYDMVSLKEGRDQNSPLIDRYCGDRIPDPIMVPGPDVFVVFQSDMSVTGDGFRMTYETKPCGGILTEPGEITSPNYPNGYHHNDNCAWKIVAPEGSRIQVHFTDFSFENHSRCGYDYLQIFNGGLPDSPASHPRCGSRLPDDFVSQSNQIRLLYATDYSVSSRGFRLEYTFVSEGCGGLFHSSQGTLTSPNHPSDYPHNTECQWDINVPMGNVVKLTFNPPFDLEAVDCVYDYVKVYDSYDNGTLVDKGTWCHNQVPPVMTSTTTRMLVVFRSDESTNGHGFSASWEAVCGGLFEHMSGTIYSPGYPQDYANNLMCTYTIRPRFNSIIDISFKDLEMEGSANNCDYDNLTITDGRGSNLGTICGRTIPEAITATQMATLTLRTDQSQVYRGFKIGYYALMCGGVFTRPAATIVSGFYNRPYQHGMDCAWNITVDPAMVITFKMRSFDIEEHSRCAFDHVSFYDGPDESSPLIGRFCGGIEDVPDLIWTTGNSMYIRFQTDHSVSRDGFRGGYWSSYGPAHGCGGRIESSSGSLSSFDADNDNQYENSLNCEWTIVAAINTYVSLTITDLEIERQTDCAYDSVSIYDGPSTDYPLLGKYCGTTPPTAPLNGSTNVMLVVFSTDYSVTQRGFNATFTSMPSLCGGSYNVTLDPSVITSVSYPNPYSLPIRCSWLLDTGNPLTKITINVTDIQLMASTDCAREYLTVRDFPIRDTGKEYHYCGTRIPAPFDSQGQMAQVLYHLDSGSRGRGFQLTYQVADCNKVYTGTSGHVTSLRHEGNYRSGINCLSTITTPEGTFLSLYFYLFDMEMSYGCQYDSLEIKNSTSDVVSVLCGRALPNPVFMPGNFAILRFTTDGSVTSYGYDITYVSSTSPGCGGDILDLSQGAITSPQYPRSYDSTQTCVWRITPPARQMLYFRFEQTVAFNLTGNADCSTNHVTAVSHAPGMEDTSFGYFCRTDTETHQWSNAFQTVITYVNSGSAPVFYLRFSTTPPSS